MRQLTPYSTPCFRASEPLHFCASPHASLRASYRAPGRRFIAKVGPDAKKTDKPAKIIIFHNGAEVPFYINAHPKAKKAQKHIYLNSNDVRFFVVGYSRAR